MRLALEPFPPLPSVARKQASLRHGVHHLASNDVQPGAQPVFRDHPKRRKVSQLFSDPGTLFWKDHFEWGHQKQRRKRVPLNK